MEWSSLTEAKPFTTVSISWPSWSADLCYCSAVGCLLLVYNGIHVYSCIGVDQNWKFNFMYLFDCFQKIMTEMKIDHWFKICEKDDDKWHIRGKDQIYDCHHISVYNSIKCTFCCSIPQKL